MHVCGVFGIAVAVFALIVALIPSSFDPTIWQNPNPVPEFKGPYAPNNVLTAAVNVGVGTILGPETIAFGSDGKGYVTQGDGHVVMISMDGEVLEPIYFSGGFAKNNGSANGLDALTLRDTCTNSSKAGELLFDPALQASCGRPLGIRYLKQKKREYLYFVDSYTGLVKYDIASRSAKRLYSPATDHLTVCGFKPGVSPASDPVSLSPPEFLDHLDVMSDGTVYMTDADYKYHFDGVYMSSLDAGPRGRLFKYVNGKTCVCMCGLHFANGVQVSISKKTLYIAETTRFRILAADLNALAPGVLTNCGEQDVPYGARVAVDSTPGPPDNIRTDGNGTIYIGFGGTNAKPFSVMHWYLTPGILPITVRTLMAKLIPPKLATSLVPKYGLVALMRDDPSAADHETIYATYHDPKGTNARLISNVEINPVTGAMWLGSYLNSFISIVKLK